jgi:hypothetical protein
MVRRIRSALKALEIAILKDVKSLLEAAAASRANDRFGHVAACRNHSIRLTAFRAKAAL